MKIKNEYLSTAQAMARFDSLKPILAEDMLGFFWRGEGIDTDHPMDRMLEASRWTGKLFKGMDDVHPLVHRGLFAKKVRLIRPCSQ